MATQPAISTVILNWNRSGLLERTLESYLRTVEVPFEIIIVDNASTDGSRGVIERFTGKYDNITSVFLDTNQGGVALNTGLEHAKGGLLHLSENDLEYLPGWSGRVIDFFDTFERLGQLSLFSPVPQDYEVWELKPSRMIYRKGRILYEALSNVGTSSVLRRELWDRGIRVANLQVDRHVLFPNDPRLSQDVRNAGYMVAWADHYLVRNLGHSEEEFGRNEDYYRENYRAKFWIGEQGWQVRRAEARKRARPERKSFLFGDDIIEPEMTPPNEICPQPGLWSMLDAWTPEIEVLEFLYGLTRLVKPEYVVETRAWLGYSALAIGRALKANGRGRLVGLEPDADCRAAAAERVASHALSGAASIHGGTGAEFTPERPVDLLLLDSQPDRRQAEFTRLMPFLAPGCMVVMTNASSGHTGILTGAGSPADSTPLNGFSLPTPRGLVVYRYTGDAGNP